MKYFLSDSDPPNERTYALQTIKSLQRRGLPANLILRYLIVLFPSLYHPQNVIPPMVEIHIGKVIRQQMKVQKITPTKMAQLLNLQRPNLYRILRGSAMNTAMLFRFSEVLQYDFFAVYSASLKLDSKKNNKNDTHRVTSIDSDDIV